MTPTFYYLQEGLLHITDLNAYDHILFILAMVAGYSYRDYKPLLILVTAFTLGHTIALALATFEIVRIPSEYIEFFIPVTIIITCIYNLYNTRFHVEHKNSLSEGDKMFHVEHKNEYRKDMFHVEHKTNPYLLVSIFGLIHGLGFSNYLRFMLAKEEIISIPLLMFNIGLEIGQIGILIIALVLNFVFLKLLNKNKYWTITVSSLIILITLPILKDTASALF